MPCVLRRLLTLLCHGHPSDRARQPGKLLVLYCVRYLEDDILKADTEVSAIAFPPRALGKILCTDHFRFGAYALSHTGWSIEYAHYFGLLSGTAILKAHLA